MSPLSYVQSIAMSNKQPKAKFPQKLQLVCVKGVKTSCYCETSAQTDVSIMSRFTLIWS